MPGVLGEARDSRGQAGVGAPPSEPARHAVEHGDRRRPARRDSPQGWQLQRPPNALAHSAGYSPSWVWGVFLFLFFFLSKTKIDVIILTTASPKLSNQGWHCTSLIPEDTSQKLFNENDLWQSSCSQSNIFSPNI